MTQPQSVQPQTQPVFDAKDAAVFERVKEIMTEGKASIMADVKKAIESAAKGGFTAPQTPETPEAPKPQAPAAPPAPSRFDIIAMMDRQRGYVPVQVPFTKAQALAAVATGRPAPEVLAVAQMGIESIGIEAAFERAIVRGPSKGITAWQAVGLAAIGGAAVAGAVVAGRAVYRAYEDASREFEPVG